MANLILTTVALIILGSSCLCNVDAKYSLEPNEWNQWFDNVFSDVESSVEKETLITTLMCLHEHSPAVDQNRKDIVEFWHGAVLDKQEHCTFEYLATLKEQQKKYMDSGYKKDAMYNFAYDKVIQDCMHRFLKGVNRAKSLTADEKSMVHDLGNVWIKKKDVKLANRTEEINAWAARLIGPTIPEAARQNKEKFVEAWRNEGACQKILTELKGPILNLADFYKKFDPGYKSFEDDRNSAHHWVRIVEGCRFFLKDQPLYEIWPYVQKLSSDQVTV